MDCDGEQAEAIAIDLASTFGQEFIELVGRSLTRTGYIYETRLEAEGKTE
jgi:hypothetical protein